MTFGIVLELSHFNPHTVNSISDTVCVQIECDWFPNLRHDMYHGHDPKGQVCILKNISSPSELVKEAPNKHCCSGLIFT